jgi:hypothetical protein
MFSIDLSGSRKIIVAELEKPIDEQRRIGLREIESWVGMTL